MLLLALAAAAANPPVAPADPSLFGDWAVACDNGRRCEAVSMMPQGQDLGGNIGLLLRREAGPAGAVTIDLRSPEGLSGPFVVKVDGKTVAEGRLDKDGKASLAPADAEAFARRLPDARTIRVTAPTGDVLGTISPAGSSAALRFMDAAQKRADTVTALVVRGRKPAAAVPPPPPLPLVIARPLIEGAATPPADALVAAMRKTADCPADDSGPVSAQPSRLDSDTTLVLLSCGAGAYNFTTVPFVVTGGKASYALFDADISEGDTTVDHDKPMLVNAIWNSKTGTLFSYAKGRGIGDCGVSRTFAWDGTRFRLIEQAMLGECRGAVQWPVVWRARVERKP